jgi:hypothetical protein
MEFHHRDGPAISAADEDLPSSTANNAPDFTPDELQRWEDALINSIIEAGLTDRPVTPPRPS